jgi:hypothetical protein
LLSSKKHALRKLTVLATMAMAIVAVAALALAANTKPTGAGKAPLYESNPFTCPGGAANTVAQFGFVVLNTNGNGDLIAEVSVKNGPPNQVYDIYVNQSDGVTPFPGTPDCPTGPTGTLTANAQGNGNAHLVEPRLPTATKFWVSADGTPTGGPILRSTAVALD